MKFLVFLFLPVLIFAKDICISTDDISTDTLRFMLPKTIKVDDKELHKNYKRKVLLANLYLKDMTKTKKEIIDYVTISELSELSIDEILKKEKQENITEEIAKSYYVANKDEFKKPKTIDLVVLTFKNKKEADSYNKDKNLPKPEETNIFENLNVDSLMPSYSLAVKDLETNKLSDTFMQNNKNIRIYITKVDHARSLDFEEAQEEIKSLLANKNKIAILNKIYGDK